MATRYSARERIFTACGPNVMGPLAAYLADDLSADECKLLAQSVQRYLEDAADASGNGPWSFELVPAADEDPVEFVNRKNEWDGLQDVFSDERSHSDNSWKGELQWINAIAVEHAAIIRSLKSDELPTVYMQIDGGTGYETFGSVSKLTWDELEILESVLVNEFHDLGYIFRIIHDFDAVHSPVLYVLTKLNYHRTAPDLDFTDEDDPLVRAYELADACVNEIIELRAKRSPFLAAVPAKESEHKVQQLEQAVTAVSRPIAASDERCKEYRDPDNYWRNVWLYELRVDGKTNAEILELLSKNEKGYYTLESENALRTAIDNIAMYHGWPIRKGRPGRPRVERIGQTPQSNGETPQ